MTPDEGSEAAAEGAVSIIVPAHNCWELTQACVASICELTTVPWELILVDDASDEETSRRMAELASERIRVIRNETRRSFSENNNLAAREASGRWLCLLNNDTLVTAGWLRGMVRVMRRAGDIGVLGNRHLFPDTGLLHHCGMALDPDGHPTHLHPHAAPDLSAAMVERDVPLVTFACVLIERSFFTELGGLDEAYRNGYEDCDFCLRAVEAGRRIVYTPASTIYHYGQQTPGRKTYNDDNWRRFEDLWGGKLERSLRSIEIADRGVRIVKWEGTTDKLRDDLTEARAQITDLRDELAIARTHQKNQHHHIANLEKIVGDTTTKLANVAHSLTSIRDHAAIAINTTK